eukprot:COSAG01_NODE_1863_length_9037_cov_37.811591_11_plen_333_part_00
MAFGTERGLLVGWYLNNCKCSERGKLLDPAFVDLTMRQTVATMVHRYNFSGVKFDGCGPADNLTRWAELINRTGQPVLVEDCHWGQTVPTGVPVSQLTLSAELCDPATPAQRGFRYNRHTKAVTWAAAAGRGPPLPLCMQGTPGLKQKQKQRTLAMLPCSGVVAQRWLYNGSATTAAELISAGSDEPPLQCVDQACGPCMPGKAIQLHACHEGQNQRFTFTVDGMLMSSAVEPRSGKHYCVAAVHHSSVAVAAAAAAAAHARPQPSHAKRHGGGGGVRVSGRVGPADDGSCAGLSTPSEWHLRVSRRAAIGRSLSPAGPSSPAVGVCHMARV